MQQHIFLLVICTGMMACSTTAPPSAMPDTWTSTTAKAADQATIDQSSTAERGSMSTGDEEVIAVAEVPAVPKADYEGDRDEVICQRVKPTGSHRARRICRTRAEIERASLEGKKTISEMERIQRIEIGN